MSKVKWAGVICQENQLTGDGRKIEQGALSWSDDPIPFRYVRADVGAHDGAETVGRIDKIERHENGDIWAEGYISLETETGVEAAGKLMRGEQNGVSVDLDEVSFEVRVAAELLGLDQETTEAPDVPEQPVVNDDGTVTVITLKAGDEVMLMQSALIRSATLVAIPAFKNARIEAVEVEEALVASSRPTLARREWFSDPGLKEPSPVTVTADGRVYGHVAAWGTCHIAYSQNTGQCVTPPTSDTGYQYFHLSVIETDEGLLSVGRLTVDTTHAGHKLNASATAQHYENTGAAAAFVRAGEDSHGIWVAGIVNPDATPAQVRALRSSPLSGDWRNVNGNLEMVGALSVNVPGFPIPRPQGMLTASGGLSTLVASGMLAPEKVLAPGTDGAFSIEELRYLKTLASREKEREVLNKAARMNALLNDTKEK